MCKAKQYFIDDYGDMLRPPTDTTHTQEFPPLPPPARPRNSRIYQILLGVDPEKTKKNKNDHPTELLLSPRKKKKSKSPTPSTIAKYK